mgnify:CR=1 FL=1
MLIRKQTGGGIQQFQTIGGEAPSFMDLARRVRDPNAGRMERLRAGVGLGGKVAAGLGTVFQTAHQLQGGNALAPLGMGYTYQGLDPTAGMRNAVSQEQQVADKVRQMQINQQAKEQFEAMQQPQQEAVPSSTSSTDFPNRSPTMEALSLLDPMEEPPQNQQSQGVVDQAAGALRGMPLQGGETTEESVTGASPLARFGVGMQPTGPAQAQQPPMTPTGVGFEQSTLQQNYAPQPPQNPGLAPHQVPPSNPNFVPQQQVVPQGQPYAGTPTSMIDPTTGRPYNQREYFEFLQRQQNKSFATYVLDEFGDMLHKADPHVAGLLAFRVYMDKMMR